MLLKAGGGAFGVDILGRALAAQKRKIDRAAIAFQDLASSDRRANCRQFLAPTG
jgi:hypothetical protein